VPKENTVPTWGYSKNGDKVFDLAPGESLPDGYFAHPAMIRGSAAEKQMRADAEKEGAPFQFEAKEPAQPAKK
jgi:hypothetical protein